MTLSVKFAGLIFALVLLASCGGGGSSGGGGSQPPNNNSDTVPDAFVFFDQSDAPLGAPVLSNTITISGINTAVTATVTNGEYSVNGAGFGSGSRQITNGQTIRLRHTSSNSFDTTTTAILNIGGVTGQFSVTTVTQDTTPNSFNFNQRSNVNVVTLIESNEITVSGINAPAPISIVGGEYRINGGTFTSTAGEVSNGQLVNVRQLSANSANTTTEAILTIGSENGLFRVTTLMDSTPPTAVITFPPLRSLTDGNSIIVRGTANDDLSDIASVKVNGVDASTSDNYATWSVPMTLVPGDNVLQVEVTDSVSNQNTLADQATIQSGTILEYPKAIEVDSANNRGIMLDRDKPAVVFVDLSSGGRQLLSDNQFPNADNPFILPVDLILDLANNRAIVLDAGGFNTESLIAVDLNTGVRTLLSSNSIPSSGTLFDNPEGMTLDETNNRILVIDSGLNAVISVDLDTGDRTLFSGGSVPATGNNFNAPRAIALDSLNDRALVIDPGATFRIIAVDLSDGSRTVFFSESALSSRPVVDITIDSLNNEALVLDVGFGISDRGIYKINLTTATRAYLTPPSNLPYLLKTPTGLGLDSVNNRILVTEEGDDAVVALNSNTGETNYLTISRTPNNAYNLDNLTGIVLKDTLDALVLNRFGFAEIAGVNINSGARRSLFGGVGGLPRQLTINRTNNIAYVTDDSSDAIFSVDLTNGTTTVVSNDTIPNNENSFVAPEGIVVDETNNLAFVVDSSLDAVLEVDLTNGQRTILADNANPNNTTTFIFPTNIALNTSNNSVLVVDPGQTAVLKIDLNGTNRGSLSTFSNNAVPNGNNALIDPQGIAIDVGNNRAVLLDAGLGALVSVDLTNGGRSILSNNTIPNGNTRFSSPVGIALDSTNNQALVTDDYLNAIIAVDLTNGQRVILSR